MTGLRPTAGRALLPPTFLLPLDCPSSNGVSLQHLLPAREHTVLHLTASDRNSQNDPHLRLNQLPFQRLVDLPVSNGPSFVYSPDALDVPVPSSVARPASIPELDHATIFPLAQIS
jgi:hypothetical protein